VFTLGGGIALTVLLTIVMVCVEESPSVHMLEAVGRVNVVEPLPRPFIWFNMDKSQEFAVLGFAVEVVVTPIANVVREWNVDDVCFPLQIWSIVVVVTAGIGLWAFLQCDTPLVEHRTRSTSPRLCSRGSSRAVSSSARASVGERSLHSACM